jgi:hypothetical protein
MKMKSFWMTLLGVLHVTPSHSADDIRSYRSRSAEGFTAMSSGKPERCAQDRRSTDQMALPAADRSISYRSDSPSDHPHRADLPNAQIYDASARNRTPD